MDDLGLFLVVAVLLAIVPSELPRKKKIPIGK